MNKYNSLKYWAKVKARIPHRCQSCGAKINQGDFYYKEKIDFVRPPPSLRFGELCEKCGKAVTSLKDEAQPADLERAAK